MTGRFFLQTDVRFGPGVAEAVLSHAQSAQHSMVTVILDHGLHQNVHIQRVLSKLCDAIPETLVLHNSVSEPDYGYLEEFRKNVPCKTELLVGIGGGSTLDLCKAVSVLIRNSGPAINYRGFDRVRHAGVPMVAIPSTAGTGSEVTPNAVFTDAQEKRRLGINSSLYLPKLALLDPLLTVSCPPLVTVSAGLDALVHAVEGFVARGATSISRMWSRQAFALLVRRLPEVLEVPADLTVRQDLQLAALYAAEGLMNSGAGLAGALSYPLGVRFAVPHGLAGGLFLAAVARWNVDRGAYIYAELGEDLPEPPRAGSQRARAEAVVAALEETGCRLGVEARLRRFGVQVEHVPMMARETLLLEGAVLQNPVPVTQLELEALLRTLL